MQNDMRDRLIDLIRQSHCVDVWDYWNDELKRPNPIEKLADYLIKNGVVPSCNIVTLPCNLKDEITLLDGEKRTVEYLVYDGEWHFGTENGEFNEREIINPFSDRKGSKESSPKESAHNSFFYNRFVKTV